MGFQHYSLPFWGLFVLQTMLMFIFLLLFKKILLEIKSHLFSTLNKIVSGNHSQCFPFCFHCQEAPNQRKKNKHIFLVANIFP